MRHRILVAVAILVGFFVLSSPMAVRAQAGKPAGGERSTFSMPEIPFGTFMKIIMEKSGMKLITSAEIARRPVTVYLPDVTPKEALEAVCSGLDLTLDHNDATGVTTIREADRAFFALQHVDAKQAQLVAVGMLGPNGKVAFDEKYNFLSAQGTSNEMANIRAMVRSMDETPRQVLIEATIAELNETAAEQIGIRWEPNASIRGSARFSHLPFGDHWGLTDGDATAWTSGFVSFQDFLVQVQFMETEGNARILATPRVSVLDRKEATMARISHIVVATKLTRNTGTLDLVTEEPVYADVGVTLKVTPRIHPDGKITLTVLPEVSTAVKSRFFSQAVDTDVRTASTTVMVADGETIAIAGMLREDENEIKRKFPFLAEIPLLKYLFTHNDTLGQKTDLVVFITPHLVGTDGKMVSKEKAAPVAVK